MQITGLSDSHWWCPLYTDTRNPTRNRALPCPDSQPGWQGRRCPSPGKGEVGLKNDAFIDQIFMFHCPLWNSSLLRAKLLLGYTEAKTYFCVRFHTTHTHTCSNSVHKGILQFSYESLVLIKAITCWKKFQLNILLNVTTFFTSNWNSQRLVKMYSCSEEECNDSEGVCSS